MLIGLDLSINNTGMCINVNDETLFFQITSDEKFKEINRDGLKIEKIIYKRLIDDNIHKDLKTSYDGLQQAKKIIDIINHYKYTYDVSNDDIYINIEGLSLHGTKIVELSEFSAIIKLELMKNFNPYNIFLMSPRHVKSAFCGKQPKQKQGEKKKDPKKMMIDLFISKYYTTFVPTKKEKIDDCVDAFALLRVLQKEIKDLVV